MEKGALVLLALIGIGVLGVGALFAFMPAPGDTGNGEKPAVDPNAPAQVVEITATGRGYEPSVVKVKAGVPVELGVTADKTAGCSRAFVMPDFDVEFIAQYGKVETARFTPQKGEHVYRCAMNMFRGKMIAE